MICLVTLVIMIIASEPVLGPYSCVACCLFCSCSIACFIVLNVAVTLEQELTCCCQVLAYYKYIIGQSRLMFLCIVSLFCYIC